MQRLSASDTAFLDIETRTMPMHTVGVLLIDPAGWGGAEPRARILELLAARLHRIPPFRRRLLPVPLDAARPVWIEDPDFDLRNHVRIGRIPAPGTRRQLADFVGEMACDPLDRRRPLWQMWVVPRLEDGAVALVAKLHHSLMDGAAGADLMMQLFDLQPDAPADPAPPEWQPDRVPHALVHWAQGVLDRTRESLALPGRAGRAALSGARALGDLARTAGSGSLPPWRAPRTPWNRPLTPERSVAFGRVSLADLKAIGRAYDASVNDVVLAACAGAFRSHLRGCDALPDTPLVVSVPVSTRSPSGSGSEGNQLAITNVRLPVQLADPEERLESISGQTGLAVDLARRLGDDVIALGAELMPAPLLRVLARLLSAGPIAEHLPAFQNAVVSNVPGPPIPLYLAGARVLATIPFGPLFQGSGLNVTVLSNMGFVDVGVMACRSLVPDVERIADAFAAEVEQLRKCAERRNQRLA